ncbi:teichoic acid transporter [Mycobacterium sp. GA-2829]|uniref:teichoic acid transporter n=1 Tax=Mycobacterium sp. GA-2829 TaxID=1772283 RepID=UPI00073FD4ED|nr:teichoic acid transporter [Mycobacterium sp. GA-2829]KUI39752.1 teichoic acid transporter [Mycobacterium sp. GA-2829]
MTPATSQDRAAHSELRRSFGWRTAAAAGGLLSTLVLTVIAYRALDARDAAAFFAILAALSIGPLMGRLGLGPNVIRLMAAEGHPVRRRAIASSHLGATALLSTVSAPVVAVIATWSLRGQAHYVAVLTLAATAIVAESVRLTLSDVFAATGRVRASVATTHHVRSMLVLPLVGMVAFAVPAPTLLEVTGVYTVVACLQLGVALAGARSHLTLARGGVPLRGAIGAGAKLFTLDLTAFLALSGTVWLAAIVFAPGAAAQYSAAATLALQVTVLESLAALAVTPPAARMWAAGARDEVVRTLSAVATLSTAVTATVVVVLAVAGPTLLALAYGDSLRAAGPLLVIMAAGGLAKTALGVNVTLLIVSGHIAEAARTAVAVLAVTVPAAVVAAVWGGPFALAVVSALSVTAIAVAQWWCTRTTVGTAAGARMWPWEAWQIVKTSR